MENIQLVFKTEGIDWIDSKHEGLDYRALEKKLFQLDDLTQTFMSSTKSISESLDKLETFNALKMVDEEGWLNIDEDELMFLELDYDKEDYESYVLVKNVDMEMRELDAFIKKSKKLNNVDNTYFVLMSTLKLFFLSTNNKVVGKYFEEELFPLIEDDCLSDELLKHFFTLFDLDYFKSFVIDLKAYEMELKEVVESLYWNVV